MHIRINAYLNLIPPLFSSMIGCVSGIIFGVLMPWAFLLSSLTAMVSGLAIYFSPQQIARKYSLYFLLGFCTGIIRLMVFNYHDTQNYMLNTQSAIEGTIIERNDLLDYPRKTQLMVSCPIGTVLANTSDIMHVLPGDRVKLSVKKKLKAAGGAFATYLRARGYNASLHFKQDELQLLDRPLFSVRRFIFETNQRLFSTYKKLLTRKTLTCFYALFLGNKHILKKSFNQTKSNFNKWGLAHFLARSGLHLVMFVAIWIALLRAIPMDFFIKQLFLLVITVLYLLFSWTSIPFARALLAFFYQVCCKFIAVQIHPLQTISLATLTLLLYNPYQLFLLEFQLTVALTLGLLWFYWSAKVLNY